MRRRHSKRVYHCVRQTTKKYIQRSSPPYPAQECPNKKMKGNDGKMYISRDSILGIWRWQPIKTRKAGK
jgi:hypothetical protein